MKWLLNEHNELILNFEYGGRACTAHISARPVYCDRGHFQVLVEGPFNFDRADSFPRYYMTIEAAINETERFLAWRTNKFTMSLIGPLPVALNANREVDINYAPAIGAHPE